MGITLDLAPKYPASIEVNDPARHQIFPDPNQTSQDFFNGNNVISLVTGKSFIVRLTMLNNGDTIDISAANLPTFNMSIAANNDPDTLPLLLAGRGVGSTVTEIDTVNGIIELQCPTDAITRYYGTQFEDEDNGSCRIFFEVVDSTGVSTQFWDQVNIEDDQFANSGSNPPAGFTSVQVLPEQDQIITPTSTAIKPLGIQGLAAQSTDLITVLEDGGDGVTVKSTGELSATIDPADGNGVGNRDYNDSRYSSGAHSHTAVDITNFDTEVANNSAVTANTAKISYTDAAAVALNTAKVTYDDQAAVALNTAKVTYDDAAAVALNTAKASNATHTGDATGDGVLTLATVNSNVGSYTNASVTVNGKGLVTAVSSGPVVVSEFSDLSDVSTVSLTHGDILYVNGSGEVVNLGAGTAAQFLKSGGPAANPLWSTPSGSGDVLGPASAVDDRVATFDLATGKLIQDGGKTIAEIESSAVATAAAATRASSTITIDREIETGAYTLVDADIGKVKVIDSGLTVPAGLSTDFYCTILLDNAAAQTLTVSGITVKGTALANISAYGQLSVTCNGTLNEHFVKGEMEA